MTIAELNLIHVDHAFLGALLALAPIISKVAGAITGKRANARAAEAQMNSQQAQDERANAVTNQALIDRNQADAVRAGLLSGVEDAGGTPGHLTGGLKPSAIKNKTAMGDEFQRAAMARLMAGNEFTKTSKVPQAKWWDKALNIVGGVAGTAALGKDIYDATRPQVPDIGGIKINEPGVMPMPNIPTAPNGLDPADIPGSDANWRKRGFSFPKQPINFG